MKRSLCMIAALCLALVAGCTSLLPVERGIAPLSARKQIPAERQINTATSTIRTYAIDAAGERREVAAAVCQISSDEFRGNVITPQMISYPRFLQASRFENRGQPAPLVVTCRLEDKSGTAVANPVPQDRARNAQSQTSTSDGQVVTASFVPMTGSLASTFPWVYPSTITVELR